MASILDLLSTQNGEHFVAKAAEKTSENKDQVTVALAVGLPIILGAIKKNIGSNDKALNLNEILENENLGEDFFHQLEKKDTIALVNQGDRILDQVLDQKKEDVFSLISTILGIKESSVGDILKMAAPMVMSILASQKRKEKIDPTALGELMDSLLGASGKFDPSLIETILAGKNGPNIIRDAKGMVLGGGNKGKKDGGILDGMVGGK